MPRVARSSLGGICYHVINRGNGRATVFRSPNDYRAFIALIGEAVEHVDPRLLGFCLMPNHFHFVVWPRGDGDLSRFMQWLLTTHVRRHHAVHDSSGHVWQGRFKAFPVQDDEHLLTVLRYVECNPLRARLVRRAENWPWASLAIRAGGSDAAAFLRSGPLPLPANWSEVVNETPLPDELAPVRACVNRGTPFGDDRWAKRAAHRLGIEASLR
ncbi:MAG: transposase, partial [Dongiaceae bacterium]